MSKDKTFKEQLQKQAVQEWQEGLCQHRELWIEAQDPEQEEHFIQFAVNVGCALFNSEMKAFRELLVKDANRERCGDFQSGAGVEAGILLWEFDKIFSQKKGAAKN